MTLSQFQAFVASNAEWFEGDPKETPESIAEAEEQLGCRLPESVRWMLCSWGYSASSGIYSLKDLVDRTLAYRTLAFREKWKLPPNIIVVHEQDVSCVWMDAGAIDVNGEYKIFWGDTEDFIVLMQDGVVSPDVDVFEDFPAWVVHELEVAQDWAEFEAQERTGDPEN